MSSEQKLDLIGKFKLHDNDTGSADVQIALITDRIESLNRHFASHVKDHSSRRGLLKLVGLRRKLLAFLKRENTGRYQKVIAALGIRK